MIVWKLNESLPLRVGRLSKWNVTLTGNLIKEHLELELTADEQQLGTQFRRSLNGRQGKR